MTDNFVEAQKESKFPNLENLTDASDDEKLKSTRGARNKKNGLSPEKFVSPFSSTSPSTRRIDASKENSSSARYVSDDVNVDGDSEDDSNFDGNTRNGKSVGNNSQLTENESGLSDDDAYRRTASEEDPLAISPSRQNSFNAKNSTQEFITKLDVIFGKYNRIETYF